MSPTLADQIKRIRARLRKSQEEFAEILGSQRNSVSRYETGRVVPGISILWKLHNLAEPDEREIFEDEIKKQAGAAILSVIEGVNELGKLPVGGTMDDLRPALAGFAEIQELNELVAAGRGDQANLRWAVGQLGEDDHVDPALLKILMIWVHYRKRKGAPEILRDVADTLRKKLVQRFGEIPSQSANGPTLSR